MVRLLRQYLEFTVAAAGVVLFFVLLLVFGLALVGPHEHGLPPETAAVLGETWPGAPDSCVTDEDGPNCYREPIVADAVVKQPFSTYSALALSAAGLWILWLLGRERGAGRRGPNPMIGDPFYQGALGWVGVLMGPGSIVFHATVTDWGGIFDQLSMYLLLGFMAAYNVVRGTRPQAERTVFSLVFGAIVVVGLLVAAVAGAAGIYLFAASGLLVAGFELLSFYWLLPRAGFVRDPLHFWIGTIGTLAAALAVWIASNPLAGPPIGFPFHLIWHVLSAAFVVAYFYYLRSERPAANKTM